MPCRRDAHWRTSVGAVDANAGYVQGQLGDDHAAGSNFLFSDLRSSLQIGSLAAKPGIPTDISAEAQDFLTRTFEFNHEARPGAGELLQHPWIVTRVRTK